MNAILPTPTERQPALPFTTPVNWLARQSLRTFFRTIDVEGVENFPTSGPVIVVANHFNSLIDGAVISGFLPRQVRFLGASTLWDQKPIVPFLNALGVIPLFRRHEVGSIRGRNDESFTAATQCLADGGVIGLFPEGQSHDNPFVLPMKSGAARIALQALDEHALAEVTIVPVGLVFEAKSTFRSRLLVRIGQPIRVVAPAAEESHPAHVRALTAEVEDALGRLALNYNSRQSVEDVALAADVWATPGADLPEDRPWPEIYRLRRRFLQCEELVSSVDSELADRLRASLERYRAALRETGVRDHVTAARYPTAGVLMRLVQGLPALVALAPLAAAGTLLNGLPYFVSRRIGRPHEKDKRATFSLVASLFLFPVMWLLAGLAAGAVAGLLTGLAVFALGPLSGLAALGFTSRWQRSSMLVGGLWRRLRAPDYWVRLVKAREALRDEIAYAVRYCHDPLWHTRTV